MDITIIITIIIDRVSSQYSPGCPRTYFIDQAGLNAEIHLSLSLSAEI